MPTPTPERVLDPRGTPERVRRPFHLADRPGREALAAGDVLFVDNGKLSSANFRAVEAELSAAFERRGVGPLDRVETTIRGASSADLAATARGFAEAGYVGAVVALADKGVTPGSTVLAIELERAGVPAVLLTAPPGSRLAEAVASLRAGELCCCALPIDQATDEDDVRAAVRGRADDVVAALARPPDELGDLAALDVALDEDLDAATSGAPRRLDLDGEGGGADPAGPGAALEATLDRFDTLGVGDGLPVVPPTERRVEAMLAYRRDAPDHVVVDGVGPAGATMTVRDVAVAAVMAGCRPEHLPVVRTAVEAMTDPRYNFLQSVTTSNPAGNLVVASGPVAEAAGLHGGQGCLGPGFRANATIGRALNLLLVNVGRAVPGVADLDCLASPAELTYCFREDPDLTPWTTLNAEHGDPDDTAVYVLKAEAPTNVLEFLADSARGVAESLVDAASHLGANNAYVPGPLVVVLVPDHARIVADDGWTKADLRRFVHEEARWPRAALEGRGIEPVRPDAMDGLDPVPVTRSPGDVQVVVAGGPGGHSAVIRPWAMHSEAVVEPVRGPDGAPARSLAAFDRD